MQPPDKINILQINDRYNPQLALNAKNDNQKVTAFRKRYYRVMLLVLPTLLLSEMNRAFIGINKQFNFSVYFIFTLTSIIFFYGGWPFFKGSINEIRTKKPGMMFTIGISMIIAYIISFAIIFGLYKMDFFWELIALILIMLLDYWIQIKSIAKASKDLAQMNQSMPIEKINVNQKVALIE